MMIGLVQPGTRRGMFLQMMASRNTVPPRMFRIVPLGERHICFSLNSSTRFSSGVMVAHLMPTLYRCTASAASTVTWSSVASRCSIPRSKLSPSVVKRRKPKHLIDYVQDVYIYTFLQIFYCLFLFYNERYFSFSV